MRTILLAAAAALSFGIAGAAHASYLYDSNIGSPTLPFGSGNIDGHFTIDNEDGVLFGLRGQERYINANSPTNQNVYSVASGHQVELTYMFDSDGKLLAGLNSLLTITNLTTHGTAAFNPFQVPDNGTSGNFTGNAEFLGFGFLNGNPVFNVGNINYGPDATYRLDWNSTWDGGSAHNRIYINQGAGTPGFSAGGVPEPASWALMIAGFGGVGAMLRRKRTAFAAAT